MKSDLSKGIQPEYEIKKNGDDKWHPLSEQDALVILRQSGAYAKLKGYLDNGEEVPIPPDKKLRRKPIK